MENTIEKDPPISAFPRDTRSSYSGEINGQESGMTLRDYFAAKAMQSHLTTTSKSEAEFHPSYEEWIVEHSYNIADAMLKHREL